MIATLARIGRSTSAERRLLAEAVAALAVAALLIALLPFRRVASLARLPPGASAPETGERLKRIEAVRWAVTASARRVPWRAKCIEQGFAAHWMLRRRAVPAVLHYGVASRDGKLAAHVWVRSDGIDVVGCENSVEFAELTQFPA